MAIDVRYNYTGVLIETTGQALLQADTNSGIFIIDSDPSDSLLWLATPVADRPASITYYLNGSDVFIGNGVFNDTVYLGAGDDLFLAGAGNDMLFGGAGGDDIYGQDGEDRVRGGGGDDFIDGGNGNDARLGGDGGNDEIHGGMGIDKIRGDQGDDELHGDEGNDDVSGDTGDDYLFGGDGNDVMSGGRGTDELHGGLGADRLGGGAEDDAFIYDAITDSTVSGTGRDIIADFQQGIDQIWIEDLGLSVFRGTAAFTAIGQVRVVQAGVNVVIQMNVSGNTTADMSILVMNQTTAQFSLADFFLS